MIIKKEVPKFRKSQKWSDAKRWIDKKVVVVEFQDSGNIFKWLPTYKELENIKKALDEIEKESWMT